MREIPKILVCCLAIVTATPIPEPWYGDYAGSLGDPQKVGITGEVYIVNNTCLQILNFTYKGDAPDIKFTASKDASLGADDVELPTFEYGTNPIGPYENARVVLSLPNDHRVKDFNSVGLWCNQFSKAFGSVQLPSVVEPPMGDFINEKLSGIKYSLGSGPILLLDRRSIKIYGFSFEGDNAPDGYFMVGRGDVEPKNGVKVPIRTRDTFDHITAMNERYYGATLIVDLPAEHDIYNIEWLSVYCVQFDIDFGHVKLNTIPDRIPPYVPLQKRYDDVEVERKAAWKSTVLYGHPGKMQNFTFQVGAPGGRRAYESWAKARPNEQVWYINGYMSPELVLQRGITYNFIVQGGADESAAPLYNPLYISDEPFGGYKKLPQDDRSKVRVFAGLDTLGSPMREGQVAVGRLCEWTEQADDTNADMFDSYRQYYDTELVLKCGSGDNGQITFTPDANTPDTVYYQSYTSYNMGYKITIVDAIDPSEQSADTIPYDYEIWLDNNHITKVPRSYNQATAGGTDYRPLLLIVIYIVTAIMLRT